MDALKAHKS
jgi:hypothetical protein